MPGIDRECEGDGATHYMACKCREEYFEELARENERLREALKTLSAWWLRWESNGRMLGMMDFARAALKGKS